MPRHTARAPRLWVPWLPRLLVALAVAAAPGCSAMDERDIRSDAGGVGGATASSSSGVGCPLGAMSCGGVCVDAASDPKNCGACGHECAAGQTCSAGACLVPCPGLLTFSGFPLQPIGYLPVDILTVDLDGDGKLDVVGSDSGSRNVYVYGNAGSPALADAKSLSFSGIVDDLGYLAAGDLDGDGKPEVVVGRTNVDGVGDGVQVLINPGDGSLAAGAVYLGPTATTGVALGDVDGDGTLDLVALGDEGVLVRAGVGDGTFGPAITQDPGTSHPNQVTLVDLDGDGALDIALTEMWAANLRVLRNGGDGTFEPAVVYPISPAAERVTSGDLDGDGMPDLILAIKYGGVEVLLNNGDGTLAPPITIPAGPQPTDVRLGDVDGDGMLDIVVAASGPDGGVGVLLNQGNAAFAPVALYPLQLRATGVALLDLDGDSLLDVAFYSWDGVSTLLNVGGGKLSNAAGGSFAQQLHLSDPGPVAIADFDGDGLLDIAIANGDVRVWPGGGNRTFGSPTDYPMGVVPIKIGTDDFDGDGRPDLVVLSDESDLVSVRLNDGGGFAPPVTYPVGNRPFFFAIGDFDGDSKPDLATANIDDDTVSVLSNDGDGTFGAATSYPVAKGLLRLVTGDFDGDGRLDLATLSWHEQALILLYNMGDGTFGAPENIALDADSLLIDLATGDFDGDGKIDLALASPPSLLLNQGDGSFQQLPIGPGYSRLGRVVDADVDGKLDFIHMRVLRGHGDGTFMTQTGYVYISLDYTEAMRDLDGDGQLDIVRQTQGTDVLWGSCFP